MTAESACLESPTFSMHKFHEMCDSCFIQAEQRERALEFLRKSGSILWYDSVPALHDTLVCDSQWLIAVMTRIVSLDVSMEGGFTDNEIKTLWPAYMFPLKSRHMIIRLLESFEIIQRVRMALPNGDIATRFVVPCVLPEAEPRGDVIRMNSVASVPGSVTFCRIYKFKVLFSFFLFFFLLFSSFS